MACLEGRNFTIKLYPQDFAKSMREKRKPSMAFPLNPLAEGGSR